MNRGKNSWEGKILFLFLGVFFLIWGTTDCKEDWHSRMGLSPLIRYLTNPFPAYSFEEFKEKLSQSPPQFGFVLLGDTDISTKGQEKDETPICADLIDLCLAINPRPLFLFHLGDIAASPGDKKAWMKFLALSKPFYIPDKLDRIEKMSNRFLLTLPGERDVKNRDSHKAYLGLFSFGEGKTYYSFDLMGVHFVALDSGIVDEGILSRYFGWNRYQDRIIGEQLEWLQNDLFQASGMPIFVMIHKPLFPPSYVKHEGHCLDRYYFERERLLNLFNKYSVKAVFSGHEPICYYVLIKNTYYFISGGAGKDPYSIEDLGGFHHFLYVAFYEGSKVVCYAIDKNGKVRLEVAFEN